MKTKGIICFRLFLAFACSEMAGLLAERLNVPRTAVRIVAGEKSRRKRVVVAGVTREQVLALLAAAKLPVKKAKD